MLCTSTMIFFLFLRKMYFPTSGGRAHHTPFFVAALAHLFTRTHTRPPCCTTSVAASIFSIFKTPTQPTRGILLLSILYCLGWLVGAGSGNEDGKIHARRHSSTTQNGEGGVLFDFG